MDRIRHADRPIRVLNLFAYTGAATIACAAQVQVCAMLMQQRVWLHLGKDNARASHLEDAPIRWIVDDCAKFVERGFAAAKSMTQLLWIRLLTVADLPVKYGSWSRISIRLLALCRSPFRRSAVYYFKFLYHSSGTFCTGIYFEFVRNRKIWRSYRMCRAGASSHRDRYGTALWCNRSLDV